MKAITRAVRKSTDERLQFGVLAMRELQGKGAPVEEYSVKGSSPSKVAAAFGSRLNVASCS
jgi:hypothetical protein